MSVLSEEQLRLVQRFALVTTARDETPGPSSSEVDGDGVGTGVVTS